MTVFVSDVDTAKLHVQLLRLRYPKSKYQCKNELSVRLQELKNKGKFQLDNPKSGRGRSGGGRLRELFITKLKSQFNQGFRES